MRASTLVSAFAAAALLLGSVLAAAAPRPVAASGVPERVVVRPDGARGPLVAYDPLRTEPVVELPAGMLAADGSRFYTTTLEKEGATTLLDAVDPTTGERLDRFALDGAWTVGGVSPTGAWVALTAVPDAAELQRRTDGKRWRTWILVVDGGTGRPAHELELTGNFEVETISADGNALFLIQHLPSDQPDRGHYLVRLFDLATETLQEQPLRDKRFYDEVMAGLAWDGLGSPDGRWLLTLYVNTDRNAAFIHALDLQQRASICIELPSGDGDPAKLSAYALTLLPDGGRVVATNPALGVVAEVDLTTLAVSRSVRFEPGAVPARGEPAVPGVAAPDGRAVYFTDRSRVWLFDVDAGAVTALRAFDRPVTGLGLSADGRRLYAAGPGEDGALAAVDATSGAPASLPASNAAEAAAPPHDHD
jgi:hypothetical protein